MLKQIAIGLCLLMIAVNAIAQGKMPDPVVAKIQSMLAKPSVLCGRFDQIKHLKGMKKPLALNGRFCVVAGKGILWRTLQPFPNTLRLTRDEIVSYQGERIAMRLNAKQEPTVRMINSVLFSLMAGDLAQLENLFEVDGKIEATRWRVALKAREPGLAKAIGALRLEGGEYVNSIQMDESGGDTTSINFSAIQSGESAMLPEEAALF